ncbi:MAG TPA: SMC family ATPase [Streptosporangiaceae bacterium]|nr:SMC family ATPase [Streptosporangiaceae bacterium]
MRLHTLEMQAFGPFARPQRIDFERLASGGLFLLEGPTGAGKTTVLDAITFALYGGLAGEDAGEDRLHSHFAGPEVEPSVGMEFSVRGVRYRITRVPEHRRPKRRGQGFTTEAMRVHLERRDGPGWMSMSSNKAEVGDLIDQIMGLNRMQFTQVILLPQGEFARFLRSDDDARRAVLTKLFGTELYDQITAELDRRRAEAVRARQTADAEIAASVSAAAEAAGLDAPARAELIGMAAAARAAALRQISEDLAAALERSAAGLKRAEAAAKAARAADQHAARQAGLMARLATALAALRAHEATRRDHETRAARLDAARRAEPVRPLLAMLTDAEAAADRERAALRDLLEVDESAQAFAGQLACLLDADADDSLVRRAGKAAAERAEAGQREAAALEHLVAAEAALPGRAEVVDELKNFAAEAAQLVASLTGLREHLPGQISVTEAELAAARDAVAGLAVDQQRKAELTRLGAAARRLAHIEPHRAAAATRLQASVDEHQRLVDEHQQAMDERLAGLAAELAAGLADGSACPVCGSATHPAPAMPTAAAVTAESVAATRELRDKAAAARLGAEHEHTALDREAAELAAITAGHTVADVAKEAADVAERLAAAERAKTQERALAAQLAELRGEQEQLGERLRAAVAAEAEQRKEFEGTDAELAALRQRLTGESGDCGSVACRQRDLKAAADASRALSTTLDGLASALSSERKARRLASDEALARGFDGLDAARSAAMAPKRQSALDDEVARWSRELVAFQAAIEVPELVGLDPARAGEVEAAALRAAAGLAQAEEAEQRARALRDGHLLRTGRLGRRLAEVREAEQAASSLAAATEPVIHLAGLAKGMDGHRRVALTTYVLRHWFGQVVAAANVRLSVMSSGRYELRRSDEGDSRRQRAGLTLVVIDRHTGEERSPKSLSGGETFYTSLALALGLADVVKAEAGGVDTETLFIDEGFGSLDAETLDQVLGVIDELRDHGRAIGIVSHVTDLKDRISERLEVRRMPDGSSSLGVVA